MKRRILAVDDEPHMLRLLERIITEKTDYDISTTSNSLQVPEILEDQKFDLIISDLKMPGHDGLDLLNYVNDNNRDELVLIITAFGSIDSATEAMTHGAFDYITKPFRKEEIIHTIDRAMSWQICRRESMRMKRIFETEPYDDAQNAFKAEYLRHLRDRHGRNYDMLAERSGLPRETIEKILDEND